MPVPIGGGTTSGSGLYKDGATVTLTAKPTFKTRFVKWSDGETSATREVTVAGDDYVGGEGGYTGFGAAVYTHKYVVEDEYTGKTTSQAEKVSLPVTLEAADQP